MFISLFTVFTIGSPSNPFYALYLNDVLVDYYTSLQAVHNAKVSLGWISDNQSILSI